MKNNTKAFITPKVIEWARDLCNLSIEQASQKIGVKHELLDKWEKGETQPTVSQAFKMSQVYRLPFAALWLEEPKLAHIQIPKIRDFRRLPDTIKSKYSYELSVQLRDFIYKRELFIELAANVQKQISQFSFKINKRENIESLAHEIRKFLEISWDEQSSWKDSRIAFNRLKEKIENNNILIFQLVDVNVEECRGFAIFESVLPIIAINRKDSYTGRIFSLIHEFIHICFHSTCMSNYNSEYLFDNKDHEERYINHLTASILMPENLINSVIQKTNNNFTINNLKKIADTFSISKESMVIRLYHLSILNYDEADELLVKIKESYSKKGKTPGFITPVNDVISKYGKPIVKVMLENYNKGYIHVDDFHSYTGLKEKHLEKLSMSI